MFCSNPRSMLPSLIVLLYLFHGIYSFNEYLEFVDESIEDYLSCINAGTDSFEAGEKFKTYHDPDSEKLYEFTYSEHKKVLQARKKGKDIEVKERKSYPPLDSFNNNNADVALRFTEKVKKVRSLTTEETTSHAGHGSVEAGVNLWIVEVSVKTTVEGDQTDTIVRESENTTTQIWDRIQVTPPYSKSHTEVKRFKKRMLRKIGIERIVSGYLPIHVKRPGKDLTDPAIWKKCGISAPIKLSDKTYIVPYENFKSDEWEPSEDGGLVQEYPEEPEEYYQEYIKFRRNLQALPRNKASVKKFCRLLNPRNKVQAVIPDLEEEEGGIVEEDKSSDDEEDGKNPAKEHNVDLNEFLDAAGGDHKPQKCKKKNKKKCGAKPKNKRNKNKNNKNNRRRRKHRNEE